MLYAGAGCGTIPRIELRLERLVSLGVWCNWVWVLTLARDWVAEGATLQYPLFSSF